MSRDTSTRIQARPTRCNVTQWYLLLQMLYTFQAVPLPVIRSCKLYTQHRVFVELFLLLTAIVIVVRSRKRPTRGNVTQWYLLLQMLYTFQVVPLPVIRSSKLYTQHRVFVELFLLLTAIVIAVRSRKSLTNTPCCVYSFELLMMGRGTAWNM